MNFEPKTESELQEAQLCAKGKAPFTVMEAGIVPSKSAKNAGKEMLKLKLNVHSDDGNDYHIYDYVAPWFMAHKFRHFFYAVNRGQVYESGNIANVASLVGLEGWCDVGIQAAKGQYGPKNIIADYVVQSATTASAPTASIPKPDEEDDVPF